MIKWYSIFTNLIEELSTQSWQKMIPSGIAKAQDSSLDHVTVSMLQYFIVQHFFHQLPDT